MAQSIDDLNRDPLRPMFPALVRTEVLKRQDGDGFYRRRRPGARPRRPVASGKEEHCRDHSKDNAAREEHAKEKLLLPLLLTLVGLFPKPGIELVRIGENVG